MSILVTGGAGFVGSHLIERLARRGGAVGGDGSIVCLDNFNDYYDPALKRKNVGGFGDLPGVKVIEADFCDQAAMHDLFARENVKSVVHLGAYAGVHASVASPHVYQRNNVQGTLALLEAARQHPVSRFLLISSSTVYGLGAAIPFQEDAPPGIPASPYGATKRAAELMGLTYHQLHSVPVVCLRPFSVYGPRLRPDLAMSIFTQKIIAGQPLSLYGDGSVRRDFTHVSDICDGLTAALSAENVAGQAINLGHSHPVEIRQVIAMLESAIGKKAIVKKHPPRAEDLPVTFADLGKATRLLNYSPKVTFEEGIPEYVDWYRSWHKV